jgi:Methyltransferase small domain
MSSTNRGAERAPGDFYETPAWLVDAVMPLLPLGGHILDAGAGSGSIVRGLIRAGVPAQRITAVELDSALAAECRRTVPEGVQVYEQDFLRAEIVGSRPRYDLVIQNPPYETETATAYEFVRRSLALTDTHDAKTSGTVAALLRLNWLEGARQGEPERFRFLQSAMPDCHVSPFRPKFGLNKHGKMGGDSCAYAWMIWRPGAAGTIRMLKTDGPPNAQRSTTEELSL